MAEDTSASALASELEARLCAFEHARREDSDVSLADFLPPRDDVTYPEVLRELIRRDLRARWRRGEPVRLESYRDSYPRLFDHPEMLRDVAFEEYCQLALAGQPVSPQDYSDRYGLDVIGWPVPADVRPAMQATSLVPDDDEANEPATFVLQSLERLHDRMPVPGEPLLDFHILRELGRGAFSRVYLARQRHLADRLVVLKVSAQLDEEPWTLAQLQHTNIVPIYSVHQSGSLQVVCMPYFGATTLAHVIDKLEERPAQLPSTGRDLLNILFEPPAPKDSSTTDTPRPGTFNAQAVVPQSRAILDMLTAMSHVNTALWIVARVADGLAHAHERGILHSDLKPANILVTDDGQPMVLDFNVSVDAKMPAELQAARVGGTLPYMAPEHLAASHDRHIRLDARCDLYSLGVILYKLLTGQSPYLPVSSSELNLLDALRRQRLTPPIPPSRVNRKITPAVDAILRKLLEPDPQRRYATASQLSEDLDRQLANRPLRFASDTSPLERMRKWRRRNPRLATAALVTSLALLLLVLPGAGMAIRQDQIARQQRLNERSAAAVLQQESLSNLRTAAVLLSSRAADRALLDQGMECGKSVIAAYAVDSDPNWTERPRVRMLPPERQAELRENLGELLLLMARSEPLLKPGDDAARQRALQWNHLAEDCFPVDRRPQLIARQRAGLSGQPAPINDAPSDSDLDLFFDGLELAAQSHHAEALTKLLLFTEHRPDHFMGWFARGICHDGVGQFPDAAAAFTICVSLQPEFPWAVFNRGLVRLRHKLYAGAESDFTRALELKPNFTSALINRALAREGQGDFAGAERDLSAALELPDASTRIYFLRAKVRQEAGDTAGALADRVEGLKRPPADTLSWVTRGVWRMADEPSAALQDFDEALHLNPRSREALQNKALVLADMLSDPRQAVAVLDRLLELYPHFVEARAGRGVYLARIGEIDRALLDAADCLREEPTPLLLYQMAGLYAQLSRHANKERYRAEALRLLAKSFRSGFDQLNLIATDTDLSPLRDEPEFKRLVESAKTLNAPPSRQ